MTEAIILDGYNIIFRLAPQALSSPEEIRRLKGELEAALRCWGQAEGVRPWIVYDGTQLRSHGSAVDEPHLRISYVDPPAEADDLIVQAAVQHSEKGSPVRVVTSDAGLAARLRSGQVSVTSVEEFAGVLTGPRDAPAPTAELEDVEAHFLRLHALEDGRRRSKTPPSRVSAAVAGRAAAGGRAALSPDTERERRRARGRRRQQRRLQHIRDAATPGRSTRSRKRNRRSGRRR